jgi:hypothetical protein
MTRRSSHGLVEQRPCAFRAIGTQRARLTGPQNGSSTISDHVIAWA